MPDNKALQDRICQELNAVRELFEENDLLSNHAAVLECLMRLRMEMEIALLPQPLSLSCIKSS